MSETELTQCLVAAELAETSVATEKRPRLPRPREARDKEPRSTILSAREPVVEILSLKQLLGSVFMSFWQWIKLIWLWLGKIHMTQLLLLGKFEYTGGPIFKVVLEC